MSDRVVGGHIVTCLDTRSVLDLDLSTMSRLFQLTTAEERILDLVALGLSNAEIAERQSRSMGTVKTQIQALLAKTGCENRTQLVRLAVGICQKTIRS